jgi:hypothetical protein
MDKLTLFGLFAVTAMVVGGNVRFAGLGGYQTGSNVIQPATLALFSLFISG